MNNTQAYEANENVTNLKKANLETMITYQEIVTHWLLLEWKMLRTDHGHDLNVSK